MAVAGMALMVDSVKREGQENRSLDNDFSPKGLRCMLKIFEKPVGFLDYMKKWLNTGSAVGRG